MDKTGRVNGPYKRLKVARQAERIRAEPPPLPSCGPYRVIVADPPWPYEIASEESTIRGVWPYPTMTVAEIAAIDLASIAHRDCILWLWTTNFHMQVVFDLLKAKRPCCQRQYVLTHKSRLSFTIWSSGCAQHRATRSCFHAPDTASFGTATATRRNRRWKMGQLFAPDACDECHKPTGGNCLVEFHPNGERRVICDKCRRLHREADVLMGLIKPHVPGGPDDPPF